MKTNGAMGGQAFVAALRQRGVLADVDVGVPSGERDLGVTKALVGVSEKRVRAREVVYPPEQLKPIRSIGQRAHSILRLYSLDWPGGGRFVPTQTLPIVQERIDAVRAEFDAAADALETEYAPTCAAWAREWRDEVDTLQRAGKIATATADDVRRRLAELEVAPWEDFRAQFYVDLRLLPVPAADDLEQAFTALEEARTHGAGLQDIRQRETNRLRSELSSFTEGLVPALRSRAIEALEHVREVAERRDGKAHGKTLRVCREEFDRIRALNFVGDAELDRLMGDFERRFLADDVVDSAKSPEAFAGAFGQAIGATVGALKRSLDEKTREVVGGFAARKVLV